MRGTRTDGGKRDGAQYGYGSMLCYFDLTPDGARPSPGTRRLIDTMFDHCRDPNAARGLAAMCQGAEALVPTL